MKIKNIRTLSFLVIGAILLGSCASKSANERSTATGWEYNNPQNGGFEKVDAKEQETGPGLVLVEGGTFTMGRTEQDVMYDWNARPARFTVGSFYMDRTEVTNLHWQEYMNWMKRVYYKTYPHIYKKCLPDTLSWRSALGYRDKFVNYYLRHPSYRDYPVVGVSWLQANDFCKWRTDRVNEAILVREGILKWHFAENPNNREGDLGAANDRNYDKDFRSMPENMFSTENYLNGNYNIESGEIDEDGKLVKGGYTVSKSKKVPLDKTNKPIPRDPYQLRNFDPLYGQVDGANEYTNCPGKRPVKMEDGILLPAYRLPTEAEWEFAAQGLIGNLDPNSENINDRRIYPWDGHYVRDDREQFAGAIQANYTRGKGDLMGVAGQQNDGADITCRVDDFWPNDYGLYHMAGNVSEWVMDVYRPLSSEDMDEFMPFRGNVYTTQLLVPNGIYDKPVKSNENIYDVYGMKEYVNEFARIKYTTHAALNYQQDTNTTYGSNIAKQSPNGKPIPSNSIINNNHMNSKINSRQDTLKYRFNSPSANFISNNKLFTNQEKLQFEFLDTLNILLDTAITLQNQGRSIAASAYIERVLFNMALSDIFKEGKQSVDLKMDIIKPSFDLNNDPSYLGISIDGGSQGVAMFSKEYLGVKFKSYFMDPTITTWIMTLRNGLTEFITTTKGSQRWRNVTAEENAGRLNYRKDDYRDYMDGDLESSIYYNNQQRKKEINEGKRDVKQVMYQSEHENKDFDYKNINSGVAGWPTTLISDKSRVYKGGSWADKVYWLSSGNRRFLDEDKSSAMIGFRCAMDRVGSTRSNKYNK